MCNVAQFSVQKGPRAGVGGQGRKDKGSRIKDYGAKGIEQRGKGKGQRTVIGEQ